MPIRNKFIVAIIVALLVLGVFYALNSYIYHQKQGETPSLQDGEHLGFIHALTDGNTSMDFDDAVWLTGKEGEDAAIRANFCTEETRDECLPNGFFIENMIKKDEQISVTTNVTVVMQTWNMEETGQVINQEISITDFAGLINEPSLHWDELPYKIIVRENVVTRIAEVYVP